MKKILIAGATGRLGRHVADELVRRGYAVRALVRRPGAIGSPREDVVELVPGDLTEPASLRGACEGVDAVLSCAGASMRMGGLGDRRSFTAVDFAGSRALLDEARRAGVDRFAYVSLFGGDRLRRTEYADAHERFVDALHASGLQATVVRPTGFFYFLGDLFHMAANGRAIVIGSGRARTNPIHEADLAEVVVDAVDAGQAEVAAGGPETFTRREIVELALEVAGRRATVRSVPPGLLRGVAALARPVNPRIHALLSFGIDVSLVDVVAPARGRRTLRSYFEELSHAASRTR